MTSLFDISATLAAPTTQPGVVKAASDALAATPAERLTLSITAMGLCVLVVWIVRRLLNGRKFFLLDAPGRPNSLGWPHILIVLLWTVANKLAPLFGEASDTESVLTLDKLIGNYVFWIAVLGVILAAAHFGFRHGITRGLGLTLRRPFADTGRGVFATLAVYPVCVGLFLLCDRIVPETLKAPHPFLELLRGDATGVEKLLVIGLAFLLVPIVEEVLYRGLMQSALRRIFGGPWLAILVSSALFSAVHLTIARDSTGAAGVVGVQALLPLFALALVLGYNYERTGRLWASIVIHMLFNGINLACALLGG